MKRKLLYSLIPILFIVCFSFIGCRDSGIPDALEKAQMWNDRALESVNYWEERLKEIARSEELTRDDRVDLEDALSDIQAEIREVKFYLEIIEQKYFGEGD
ncbi:hypothetical protein ES703_36861 [subsurface metagenome]